MKRVVATEVGSENMKSRNDEPMSEKPSLTGYLSGTYDQVFGKIWPAWIGGILLGVNMLENGLWRILVRVE